MTRMSTSLHILIRTVLIIGLTWVLHSVLPSYIVIGGKIPAAYVLIGIVLALLNLLVRPILKVVAFPLKLFATLLALILVNVVMLWIATYIVGVLDPEIVTFAIAGGITGWIIAGFAFGLANWAIHKTL